MPCETIKIKFHIREIDSKHPTDEVYTFTDSGLVVKNLQDGKITTTEYRWDGEIMVAQ